MLSIHVRPPEIEGRQLPGHWEDDLIKGEANASAVSTLVERNSRLLMLSVAQTMQLSMTYDKGRELAMHEKLREQTGIPVYFRDPQSPWQRGSIENTNGLVRQYLPKGTDLSGQHSALINYRVLHFTCESARCTPFLKSEFSF